MNPYSLLLVCAQFILIALILSPIAGLMPQGAIAILGCLLMMLAVVLAGWAAQTLRLANFSVLPEPVSNAKLIENGPYQYVRHPMYSAVLLLCAGAVLAHGLWLKLVLLVVLLGVLIAKIRREETLLHATYEGYDKYSQRTQALIPWVC